jgi:hypothetical protein
LANGPIAAVSLIVLTIRTGHLIAAESRRENFASIIVINQEKLVIIVYDIVHNNIIIDGRCRVRSRCDIRTFFSSRWFSETSVRGPTKVRVGLIGAFIWFIKRSESHPIYFHLGMCKVSFTCP